MTRIATALITLAAAAAFALGLGTSTSLAAVPPVPWAAQAGGSSGYDAAWATSPLPDGSAGCFSGNRIGTSNPAGIGQVAPCQGAPTSSAVRTPWRPAPAAPDIDYRKIPLPPPQPTMPTP